MFADELFKKLKPILGEEIYPLQAIYTAGDEEDKRNVERVLRIVYANTVTGIHHKITQHIDGKVCMAIDGLLTVSEGESFSAFEKLKGSARTSSVKNLQKEIIKLQQLRSIGISKERIKDVPFEVQKLLKRRANNETASEMRNHPDEIRYGLMSCFISIRTMEIIMEC